MNKILVILLLFISPVLIIGDELSVTRSTSNAVVFDSDPSPCATHKFVTDQDSDGTLTCDFGADGNSSGYATGVGLTPLASPPVVCSSDNNYGVMYYDTSNALCVCTKVATIQGWTKIVGDGTCS